MNDLPSLPPGEPLVLRGRQLRTSSGSPIRQRLTDDLLTHLTPRTAVEAFRNPSGTLKVCMDSSTPAEQAFALRAAVASQKIQEWLEELSSWPWPEDGGSTGFEMPAAKRRKLSQPDRAPSTPDRSGAGPTQQLYMGSLLAAEVVKYEKRIEEIGADMDELDVEEIKSHVLHNHIMPLSRPGTPMSESSRSGGSFLSYTRMDDLTALITATIVQSLPNLSRLARLLNAWSVRITVLQRIPLFLTSLGDAEVALQSGWNAIDLAPKSANAADERDGDPSREQSTLSRNDFEVMKSILERKVAKPGRGLDSMLDALEGREDTLPEDWIDRMDSLERDYSQWVAVCERKVREAEWAKMVQENRAARAMSPVSPERSRDIVNGRTDIDQGVDEEPIKVMRSPKKAINGTNFAQVELSPSKVRKDNAGFREPTRRSDVFKVAKDLLPPSIKVHPVEDGDSDHGADLVPVPGDALIETQLKDSEELAEANIEATGALDGSNDTGTIPAQSEVAAADGFSETAKEREETGEDVDTVPESPLPSVESDFDGPSESDMPEPELPTLPRPRRDSDASNSSTIIHGQQSGELDFSSDVSIHGTPELGRRRELDLVSTHSDDVDIPSSPPDFRSSTRSVSVSFADMPTVTELPDDESPPKTPVDSSAIVDDDAPRDMGSPSKMSVSSADEYLQQQIGEILEKVPAKIRLTSIPSQINLNPPDFTMPTNNRSSKSDFGNRSYSSLSTRSSRAGTPSFTLAPAFSRNSRARHQRGNQEIKLYHLSRSNGEAPIKLFIRCVGENGERVMVRVGGGWADLGEYLKEYASHHGRRSGGEGKVEIQDLPMQARVVSGRAASRAGSSPPSRPASALEAPITPLNVRKTRRSVGEDKKPTTPFAISTTNKSDTPSSEASTRSRSSSRVSWVEEDSSLGMAGPKAKNVEMSDESKAWVESVKEKVRIASGERRVSESVEGKFGELGKVGATKRLFRRQV